MRFSNLCRYARSQSRRQLPEMQGDFFEARCSIDEAQQMQALLTNNETDACAQNQTNCYVHFKSLAPHAKFG